MLVPFDALKGQRKGPSLLHDAHYFLCVMHTLFFLFPFYSTASSSSHEVPGLTLFPCAIYFLSCPIDSVNVKATRKNRGERDPPKKKNTRGQKVPRGIKKVAERVFLSFFPYTLWRIKSVPYTNLPFLWPSEYEFDLRWSERATAIFILSAIIIAIDHGGAYRGKKTGV